MNYLKYLSRQYRSLSKIIRDNRCSSIVEIGSLAETLDIRCHRLEDTEALRDFANGGNRDADLVLFGIESTREDWEIVLTFMSLGTIVVFDRSNQIVNSLGEDFKVQRIEPNMVMVTKTNSDRGIQGSHKAARRYSAG